MLTALAGNGVKIGQRLTSIVSGLRVQVGFAPEGWALRLQFAMLFAR